jgi:hypothetical protein
MRHFVLAVLLLPAVVATAQADTCESWTHRGYPVTMEACSYKGGGSGYYKITNNGHRAASICWTVVASDGNKDRGCNSNVGAGASTRGSCFQCGSKNGGVKHILLRSYKPKN